MRPSSFPSFPSTRVLPTVAVLVVVGLGAAILPAADAQQDGAGTSSLRLAEILPVPDGPQGQREFVELWNAGNRSVDLAGWVVHDAPTASGSSNSYTFSTGRLGPGARIVLWSNATADGAADARGPSWSTSTGKTVWNDAGDAVTLLDPDGTVADWLAYGNSAAATPDGFAGAKPAAPARGLALALDGSSWQAGPPTPALGPGQSGGLAGSMVLNVAPTARLVGLPSTLHPGAAVDVEVVVEDGNGVADVTTWTLDAGGATVADGGELPDGPIALTAPGTSGPWTLELTATDAGGLTAKATATVNVRDARLSVVVPGGQLRFPDLRPGDRDVAAAGWATLHNDGTDAVSPLLDVSPFTGPTAAAAIPVDGNLWIGLRGADGNGTSWHRYGGPLTPLPALAPGAVAEMTLRLDAVPSPLPAGPYGTTFALVAA